MPTPASVGDKFQVRVVGRIEGQETNNILHFMAATAIDDVETRLVLALSRVLHHASVASGHVGVDA